MADNKESKREQSGLENSGSLEDAPPGRCVVINAKTIVQQGNATSTVQQGLGDRIGVKSEKHDIAAGGSFTGIVMPAKDPSKAGNVSALETDFFNPTGDYTAIVQEVSPTNSSGNRPTSKEINADYETAETDGGYRLGNKAAITKEPVANDTFSSQLNGHPTHHGLNEVGDATVGNSAVTPLRGDEDLNEGTPLIGKGNNNSRTKSGCTGCCCYVFSQLCPGITNFTCFQFNF